VSGQEVPDSFDEIVQALRADDPRFGVTRPRRRWHWLISTPLTVLAGVAALVVLVLFGWLPIIATAVLVMTWAAIVSIGDLVDLGGPASSLYRRARYGIL
jgi:Flp pilus assembly protein TadB